MSKPSQHVFVTVPHPLLRLVSLGLVAFVFTLFSLVLSRVGTQLAPLWFPTSIMMVAFYRHAGRLWPGIAVACSLGSIGASLTLFPAASLNFSWTAINIIEAATGAILLRKLLPSYNPLQNLNDWFRLAIGSAVIPPLLGGLLFWLIAPEAVASKAFLIWVLSEAIGALTLVPLGLLFKPHYLLRHRDPHLLLETLLTLVITLALSWLAMRYIPWPFTCVIVLLMWSAVRLPRMEAFLIFLATVIVVSLMLANDPTLLATPKTDVMVNMPWLPFLMILLPANMMTMVMYAFRTERKHITESESRFRNAMEYSAIGMALVGTEGQWLQVNKSLSHFLGYSQDELRTMTFQQLTWPEDLNNDLEQLNMLVRGDINSYSMEKRYYTRNGDVVWALLAVSLVRHKDNKPLYFIAQIEDINDLKQSEQENQRLMERITQANEALFQEKERLHITLDSIGEAVVCIDVAMNITFMNPIAEKMSGWRQEDALGTPLLTVLRITSGDKGPLLEDIYRADRSRSDMEQEIVLHCHNGGSYDIHYSITPLSTLDGDKIGSVLVIQDVTESRKMLRQLSYSATHDALTQLANRASFEKQLQQRLQTIQESPQHHALVFIDLDRFKAVNDSARFIATRLINAINEYHFMWEGRLHRIGASAGITMINEHNCQLTEVVSQADIACYAAKNSGRGRLTVYEPQHALTSSKGMMPLEEQWHMIKNNHLLMLARNVAPPRTPEATSFWLVSLRLWTSEGEVMEERAFRAGLADSALHHALDRRVFHEFFHHAATAVASKGLSVALPLSAAGLYSATLIDELLEQLEHSPLPPRLLHLIIPADVIVKQAQTAAATLRKLRQRGCQVILSHVGRDLQLFNLLPLHIVDYLLLDSDLIANVHESLMDEMLTSIIQGHAQHLDIKTLAGPVQNPQVLDTLSRIGVDLIYGDTIAEAQPLDLLLNTSYFAIH
ncbi:MASE1 domain-containing protein [Salmonella enterica]|uniref:Anti-FlhC(2)FlhD(4) factor YdiV n=1 Tax=Salmonella typhimurium TaxID=90371 RepID=A0A3Y9YFR7_SALTM|nr:MASE1 domain-containing protein [Salmonella enterica]EDV4757332.1 PAS domain S-box protein [Salmonella enterica subsp. enterica]EAB2961402.1 PAS domain S-box protein [Salmonella enterica]EAB8740080.1 PAS domain S-box protein [Salmonella enterica subsp. enterica serovar Typhimurium]EAS4448018.1 PAS domain S-box protein [Salmonella enterica]EAW3302386.1 PAS domain S-box protein [Salmonella enterica]